MMPAHLRRARSGPWMESGVEGKQMSLVLVSMNYSGLSSVGSDGFARKFSAVELKPWTWTEIKHTKLTMG